MGKITPFLWFDGNAEEAVNLYLSVFENSKVTNVNRSQDGAVFSMTFELDGQEFMALNGGPMYRLPGDVRALVRLMTVSRLSPDAEHALRELAPRVLGAVMRRCSDFAAAEDAVQEAL
jgi:uncharacterized glyoxalase superfamily protein PhnB